MEPLKFDVEQEDPVQRLLRDNELPNLVLLRRDAFWRTWLKGYPEATEGTLREVWTAIRATQPSGTWALGHPKLTTYRLGEQLVILIRMPPFAGTTASWLFCIVCGETDRIFEFKSDPTGAIQSPTKVTEWVPMSCGSRIRPRSLDDYQSDWSAQTLLAWIAAQCGLPSGASELAPEEARELVAELREERLIQIRNAKLAKATPTHVGQAAATAPPSTAPRLVPEDEEEGSSRVGLFSGGGIALVLVLGLLKGIARMERKQAPVREERQRTEQVQKARDERNAAQAKAALHNLVVGLDLKPKVEAKLKQAHEAMKRKQFDEALRACDEAIQISEGKGSQENALRVICLRNRAVILYAANRLEEALHDTENAIKQCPPDCDWAFRATRAFFLAKLGRFDEVLAEADAFHVHRHLVGLELYEAAEVMAVASIEVRKDKKHTASENTKRAELLAARAVSFLNRATLDGYFNEADTVKRLRENRHFDPLRSRAEYKAEMGPIESRFQDAMTAKD